MHIQYKELHSLEPPSTKIIGIKPHPTMTFSEFHKSFTLNPVIYCRSFVLRPKQLTGGAQKQTTTDSSHRPSFNKRKQTRSESRKVIHLVQGSQPVGHGPLHGHGLFGTGPRKWRADAHARSPTHVELQAGTGPHSPTCMSHGHMNLLPHKWSCVHIHLSLTSNQPLFPCAGPPTRKSWGALI